MSEGSICIPGFLLSWQYKHKCHFGEKASANNINVNLKVSEASRWCCEISFHRLTIYVRSVKSMPIKNRKKTKAFMIMGRSVNFFPPLVDEKRYKNGANQLSKITRIKIKCPMFHYLFKIFLICSQPSSGVLGHTLTCGSIQNAFTAISEGNVTNIVCLTKVMMKKAN